MTQIEPKNNNITSTCEERVEVGAEAFWQRKLAPSRNHCFINPEPKPLFCRLQGLDGQTPQDPEKSCTCQKRVEVGAEALAEEVRLGEELRERQVERRTHRVRPGVGGLVFKAHNLMVKVGGWQGCSGGLRAWSLGCAGDSSGLRVQGWRFGAWLLGFKERQVERRAHRVRPVCVRVCVCVCVPVCVCECECACDLERSCGGVRWSGARTACDLRCTRELKVSE